MLIRIKKIIKKIIPSTILTYKLPPDSGECILLTFDDGPDKQTPTVLQRLKEHNARAVFFVIGKQVERYPEIFHQIISDGHIIGNHTYSHPNQIIHSPAKFYREANKCSEIIIRNGGKPTALIRPPLGASPATIVVAKYLRMRTILWSIEGGECGIYRHEDPETISTRLKKNIAPGDIVLLHDRHHSIISILNILLPYLSDAGFDLKNGASSIMMASRTR